MTAADLNAFESRIRDKWERGELPCLLHLCGGNEQQLVEIFEDVKPGDWVFSTHRNHFHALLAGIDPARLESLIDAGKSMFVFDRRRRFLSSAILAGTCGIAAGVAWDIKRAGGSERVWCFLGDGAEESGHFYEAALFVEAQGLPCVFVIEDNNRQVETPRAERRGDGRCTNRPLDHFACVDRYHYSPTYPHAGSGAKPGTIKFKPEAIERMRQG